MTKKPKVTQTAETPPNGTIEEWNPRTAHEVLVGMFHGLRNVLVPAKHHLGKVPDKEAKAALKDIGTALDLVGECVNKFAKVPGPIRANFHEGPEVFVVVESDMNRIDVDVNYEGVMARFTQVNLRHRKDPTQPWQEITIWDEAEWRISGSLAFEAILSVIAKVMAGEEIAP